MYFNNRAQILISAVDQTSAAFNSVKRNLSDMSNAARSASRALSSIVSISASAAGVAALAQVSDKVKLIDARMRIAAGSAREFADAQAMAYRVSAQTGAGYDAVATLYTRLALAARGFGLTHEQMKATAEATAKSIVISGASVNEAISVVRQFSQALGSGILRGDEFNSIMENGGRLAKALADGLGLPVSKLRSLAEQGLLTTDIIVRALQSQRDAIEKDVQAMPQTIARSMAILHDNFGIIIRQLDSVTGVSDAIALSITNLGSNLRSVIGGFLVVASSTLTAVFFRLSVAVKESIVTLYGKIAAEVQAARTAQILAEHEVAKARAMLASAQAAVAASTGMARLTAVQNLLVPAQQRLAAAQAAANAAMNAGGVAARVFSSALGLVGGPLGLILTLLSAGAAAWVIWGNNAESAANKAKKSAQDALDVMERWEKRKRYGEGDEAILRQDIERLEKLQAARRESLNNSPGARKLFDEDEKKLAKMRATLAEIEKAQMNNAPGAPTEAGRELMRRRWNAYLKQFRGQADKLRDALNELRSMAKDAGISETSEEFKKAEALIRAKFGAHRSSVSAPKDNLAEQLALVKARSDAELAVLKDGLARQQTALDAALEDRLVSVRDYYAQKTVIEQREVDAEIARTQAVLAEQRRISMSGKDESTRLRAKAEVAKAEADLIVLNNRRADIEQANARKAAQAERELRDALAAAREELAQMTGTATDVDRQSAIERSYRDLRARLLAESDTEGVSIVDRLINVKAAQANLYAMEEQWRQAQERMRISQDAAKIAFDAGLITQSEYQQRVAQSSQEAAVALDALIPRMEAAAAAIGPDAVLRVEALKNELTSLRTVVDPIAQAINTDVKNAFVGMFEAIGSGAKTAKDAFLDFARSVILAINRIAAQRLAEQIFGSFSKGGGFGELISGLFKGFASGGYVTGPGTSTSDSVPARLSAGEYVVRAAAVRQVGVAFLDAINGLRTPPAWAGGRLAFAAGGLVPEVRVSTSQQQVSQSVRIVNAIDPSVTHDHLQSPAGERVIVNIIGRNARAIRAALQG